LSIRPIQRGKFEIRIVDLVLSGAKVVTINVNVAEIHSLEFDLNSNLIEESKQARGQLKIRSHD